MFNRPPGVSTAESALHRFVGKGGIRILLPRLARIPGVA
jgi:hypothetical protein